MLSSRWNKPYGKISMNPAAYVVRLCIITKRGQHERKGERAEHGEVAPGGQQPGGPPKAGRFGANPEDRPASRDVVWSTRFWLTRRPSTRRVKATTGSCSG